MVALISLILIFLKLQVAQASCIDEFLDFQALNPTASLSNPKYNQPRTRGLVEYSEILLPLDQKLRDKLPKDGVIVDVGGGEGQAMKELIREKRVHAIVIDSRSKPQVLKSWRSTLEFIQGWAEDVLRRLPSESADLVTDLWGGFSYSVRKDVIVEEIYRVLKPGGKAYILLNSVKTPTLVFHKNSLIYQDFGTWLESKFPGTFNIKQSFHPDYSYADIIEVSKPLGSPNTICLNLSLKRTRSQFMTKNTLPYVEFIEN